MAEPLTGLIPAAHTPMRAAGGLNLAMIERQADAFNRMGRSAW
jgi:dihydrodipicolinate synthase/N-acetylneuraminate lyase